MTTTIAKWFRVPDKHAPMLREALRITPVPFGRLLTKPIDVDFVDARAMIAAGGSVKLADGSTVPAEGLSRLGVRKILMLWPNEEWRVQTGWVHEGFHFVDQDRMGIDGPRPRRRDIMQLQGTDDRIKSNQVVSAWVSSPELHLHADLPVESFCDDGWRAYTTSERPQPLVNYYRWNVRRRDLDEYRAVVEREPIPDLPDEPDLPLPEPEPPPPPPPDPCCTEADELRSTVLLLTAKLDTANEELVKAGVRILQLQPWAQYGVDMEIWWETALPTLPNAPEGELPADDAG